ncbi:HAMP domain-containing sensor histidine kinase [Thermoflexus sp.]|uniref:sensor histidine kinase n=1 Tax=Thermoflexus sp. TaxID=1969742 RepID=UPI0025E59725|nr:HAMP domain-containing sensor histidine kinase [Thermoflexus sp.]MDW8180244.1 HAMP domain-containing sensor histidine kinase [Anaerolineae bacterium]MCS6963761.1 HAMP domain-containing histidine kinase [Thermoflexus sp.]MCS7350793.1 HAMP domain-containing histidine kinase [Thermoflexus sp.]MCX7689877.1 HAMP domain-containing histidine kinase [Thermoflexus sp.]MDW8183811.1 HAMP domain-containing sensor histidine kinase [Anaerolineae bacterium]
MTSTNAVLEELARSLRDRRDSSALRRAALEWAVRWTRAVDGAFLVRESEGWRCQEALHDPLFWERDWELPERADPSGWWDRENIRFLAIPLREGLEWLGMREPDPAIPTDRQIGSAAGLLIGLALEAARDREAYASFFSTAVHELRLPMTSIKGYADLLAKGIAGPLTDPQRRFVEIIRSNIDRLAGLVNDLLEYSRIETGRLRMRWESISLREILQEALQRMRAEMEGRGHRVEVDLPGDLPMVASDRERLISILSKVLDNAAKYTPPGGEIRIRAVWTGEAVLCEITDSGIGISPEDQARLFTPFWRSEDPMVREIPGFGLSLAVARGLLQAMGGGIEIESALGQGTRVRIRLPAAQESQW